MTRGKIGLVNSAAVRGLSGIGKLSPLVSALEAFDGAIRRRGPHHPREWSAACIPRRSAKFAVVDAMLLDRAGALWRELVAFPCEAYERAAAQVVAQYGDSSEAFDEHRLLVLWDYFVLEHKRSDGRGAVRRRRPEPPEGEQEVRTSQLRHEVHTE